jgi:ABC-2 type transport system permease protein
MHKLLAIAREELAFHLRQGSFYASLAVMVGIFAAVGAFPQLQTAASTSPLGDVQTVFTVDDTITNPTGIVDHADLIVDISPEQNLISFTSEEDAVAALELGEIDRYYVIAADYMDTGQVTGYSLEAQLIVGSDSPITRIIRRNLLRQLDDPYLGERLQTPTKITYDGPPIPTFNFVPPDLDTGRLAVAAIIGAFFTFLINISGALLLRAIQRESEARALEIVITSTTPGQFIGGKLLGLSTLVLVQASVTLVVGLLVYGRNPSGLGPAALPPNLIAVALPFLLLGYLAYSGTMLCIAAILPNLAESTQLQFFIRIASLMPMLGVVFILPNANGPMAVWLTTLPIFAPLLMPFRVLITAVPPWQIIFSLLIQLIWAGLLIWVATRLFRVYSLLTGRTPMLRAVWTAVVRGS